MYIQVVKKAAVILGAFLLCAGAGAAWLYFYTADLPPISQLEPFNPASESELHLRFCDGTDALVHVVPYDKLGHFVLAALAAAEGKPDPRSPYRLLIVDLMSDAHPHSGRYSFQIARTLTCERRSSLRRQFQELRIASAVHRHFSGKQIVTVYLNRVYLGTNAYGVEAGANKYFGKHASALSLEEAALLVGLIRAPNQYSPTSHPDRAIERRNSILDEMVSQDSVSRADADRAKTAGLGLAK